MKTLKITLGLICVFSILFLQFVNAQWSITGNSLTTCPGIFGTTNVKDIQIKGDNHQIGYIGAGCNATEGAFGIGYLGSYPQNKLLVENGTIYNSSPNTTPYLGLQNTYSNFSFYPGYPASVCVDPVEMGIFSVSNQASNSCNLNQAIIGFANEDDLAANAGGGNGGVIGIANGAGSNNSGGFFYAYGADPNNYGSQNVAVNGFAEGSGASNTGGNFQANVNGKNNVGVVGELFGSTGAGNLENLGVVGDLSTLSNPGSSNTIPYYAIYGLAPSGATHTDDCYAGYFNGDVYTSGTYLPSDSKLKDNITVYTGALDKLNQLNVKSYIFKQKDFPAMNLPSGPQVGILAEDLKKIFPNLIKASIQPAIRDEKKQKILYEAVSYDAVNYDALIPVLIQGVKEVDAKTAAIDPLAVTVAQQQAQIAQLLEQVNSQNNQINDLRNMVSEICNVGCGGLQGNTAPVTPQDVTLYQSIPNPTSSVATIGYVINIPFTTASINITTLNGGAVQQFKITESGKGSITFDGSR